MSIEEEFRARRGRLRPLIVSAVVLLGIGASFRAQGERVERFLSAASDPAPRLASFHFVSKSVVSSPSGPFESTVEVYFSAPDRYREVSRLPFGEVVTVWAEPNAWARTPRGVRELTPDQRKRTEERLFRSYLGLLWAASQGALVLGEGRDEGRVSFRIGDLAGEALFEDETGRLAAVELPGVDLRGQPVTEARLFSDFRELAGLEVPTLTEILHDGALVARETLSSLEIDTEIPAVLFERPPFPE